MQKLLLGLLVLAVLVAGGYYYGSREAARLMSVPVTAWINTPQGRQVVDRMLSSPGVQAELAKLGTMALNSELNSTGLISSGKLNVAAERHLIQTVLTRVQPVQLARWAYDYERRASLSPAQKRVIETQILSQVDPAELRSLAAVLKGGGAAGAIKTIVGQTGAQGLGG